MIQLYDIDVLQQSNPVVRAVLEDAYNITEEREINGIWKLTFSYDATQNISYLQPMYVAKFEGQYFRIKTIKANHKTITAECEHIFFDCKSQTILGIAPVINIEAADFLYDYLRNCSPNNILPYAVSGTTIDSMEILDTPIDTAKIEKRSVYDAIDYIRKTANQGELYINNDRYTLVKEFHQVTGVGGSEANAIPLLDAEDVTITTDMSDLVTRIRPFGKNDLPIQGGFVTSGYADTYGIRERCIDFSSITDAAMLLARANYCFSSSNPNRLDVPRITITCTIPRPNNIYLGCWYSIEGYNKRVIKTVRDIDSGRVSVTLGDISKDTFYYMRKISKSVKSSVDTEENIKNDPSKYVATQNIVTEAAKFAEVSESNIAEPTTVSLENLGTNMRPYMLKMDLASMGIIFDEALGKVGNWVQEEGKTVWEDYESVGDSQIYTWITGNRPGLNWNSFKSLTDTIDSICKIYDLLPSTISRSSTTSLLKNNLQLYYTSISGDNAYKFVTTTSPLLLHPNLTNDMIECFEVRIPNTQRKTVTRHLYPSVVLTSGTDYSDYPDGTIVFMKSGQ